MFASVLLDMPPSSNRMWRKGPFGMHPSAEYKAWKTAAATEVMASRKGQTFDHPVEVIVIIKRAHKLRDLDNQIKPILDALQLGQVIEDDNQVHALHARWAYETDLPSLNNRDVRVEIRSAT
jgi:Holliday junction resolvase RusA-like endonuclease